MIEFENVTKKYRGSVTALSGISLRIREKGVYCLLGRNGAGKTTFMRVLAGKIPVSSGGAYINGNRRGGHRPPALFFILIIVTNTNCPLLKQTKSPPIGRLSRLWRVFC